jgi:Immunity protein Imm1
MGRVGCGRLGAFFHALSSAESRLDVGGSQGVAYPVTVEWQEHSKPVAVDCPDDLSRLLDHITSESEPDRPALAIICNEGGSLTIGLSGPVGTLNHVLPSNDPPYMICLGNPDAEGVIDFYLGGHHTQYLMRNTIPNALARAAALEYAESGKLPNSVAWEDV